METISATALFILARTKLTHEVDRREPNLRVLIAHANLIDSLIPELCVANLQMEQNTSEYLDGEESGEREEREEREEESDSDSDSDPDTSSDEDPDTGEGEAEVFHIDDLESDGLGYYASTPNSVRVEEAKIEGDLKDPAPRERTDKRPPAVRLHSDHGASDHPQRRVKVTDPYLVANFPEEGIIGGTVQPTTFCAEGILIPPRNPARLASLMSFLEDIAGARVVRTT